MFNWEIFFIIIIIVEKRINIFGKFALLSSNPLFFPSSICLSHLPPSTHNEWTVQRSLREQLAKTEAIPKGLFESRKVNFILNDY